MKKKKLKIIFSAVLFVALLRLILPKGFTSFGLPKKTYLSLTDEQKAKIIENLCENIDSPEIRAAVGYCLEHLGDEYSQQKRMSDGYKDCSSLIFLAYKSAGVDISNGDMTYARAIFGGLENEYAVSVKDKSDFLPGDLIFYGGADNGRYKGISHVAIYVSDGMIIDATPARNVSYRPLTMKNNMFIARVCK